MTNHPLQTSPTTLDAIREHVIDSEKRVSHPYLDIKGNVTIGVGFKVNNEDQFTNLNLVIEKDGKSVAATDAEKRQAYREMKTQPKDKLADFYEDKSNVRLPKPAMDSKLDQEIVSRIDGIRRDVGDKAWNTLTDRQKAAVADIAYANGSLDKYDELKKAIKAGDDRAMADESLFFTDREEGRRDKQRLQRNYEALSGLPPEEFERAFEAALKKADEEWAKKRADEKAKEKPALDGVEPLRKPEPPGRGGDAASDPDDTTNPNEADSGDSGDDDAGTAGTDAGGAQSERPEAATERADDEQAEAAKVETPEAKAFLAEVEKDDGIDDILVKPVGRWTAGEAERVMKARIALPASDPRRDELFRAEQRFFEHAYGTGPVARDATGRMIEPKLKTVLPERPVAAVDADGRPLQDGLRRVARRVAAASDGRSMTGPVRQLQDGLNLLSGAMTPETQASGAYPRRALKTDGVFGPKTRGNLKSTIARLGASKVEEGLALGRFRDFAREARRTGRGNLAGETGAAFGHLFRDPKADPEDRRVDGRAGRIEAATLQETINDLGPAVLGGNAFPRLKLDGRIGPKTRDAFDLINKTAGPDKLTRRFGRFLGFLD